MKKLILISIVLLVALTSAKAPQPYTVTGRVLDENGNGIPKVTVTVLESKIQDVTDKDGNFKVYANPNFYLKFSHPEFESKRVAINGQSQINVTLKRKAVQLMMADDELEIDECVSIGEIQPQQKSANFMIRGISRLKSGKRGFYGGMQMAEAMRRPEYNTENYASINESGFKDVFNNPLSTFSIDVDNASYSNIRRYLNQGQMPPVDAVRIEEMINYFSYEYEKPKKNDPFSMNAELATCPWDENHHLLMVGLQAKEIDKTNLPPSNLVFLLDVSGSMDHYNKLPLVKSGMRLLVDELRPNDRVAIVVYAGAAGLVLESTPGNMKQKIRDAINNLSAGGSTAGGEGLKLAYKTARENFIEGGNNRIILATDGDFNVGVSSTSEMERLVEQERESGIFMTVLGVGTGNIKDDKMETIADKGNGNYSYIDNVQEARKVLVSEFGGTLFAVAKDVKLQLEFNPQHVKAYRLIGYENRLLNNEDFIDDKKDAGEMGMGHTVTALYEIIPAGSNEKVPNVDELRYQQQKREINKKYSNELVTIKSRYKQPDGDKSTELKTIVGADVKKIEKASDNLRFAAAVSGFGMVLRNSEHKGNLNYNDIVSMAKKSKGEDEEGYRGEFIRLVKVAESVDTRLAKEDL